MSKEILHDENVNEQSETLQPEAPNPFDPARYRLSQDHAATVGVKKMLTTVPVGRRGNEIFFRIHPSEEYRANVWLLELKTDKEKYWVDPSLWGALASESALRYKAIFTGITRQKVVFLWDISLPGPDGRENEWNRSALEAANLAMGILNVEQLT